MRRPGRDRGGFEPAAGDARIPPPAYLLASVIAMIVLDRLLPAARFRPPPVTVAGLALVVLGVAVIAVGMALHIRATDHFRRRTTTTDALGDARVLVTDGPYRRTRNPMYLAGVIMLAGLALFLGSATPVLVVPTFAWRIWRDYIRREEDMLAERFGAEYDAYRSRVRRWI